MTDKLCNIRILNTVNTNKVYSITDFRDNLLEIWYYDINAHPKNYLIEDLINMICSTKDLNNASLLDLIYILLDIIRYKLNPINYFIHKDSWDYVHYIYMFNKAGKIIGNVIEISYDEYSYIDADIIADKIYEVIKKNAGNSNHCFYLYITDNTEIKYNHANMNNFYIFRMKNYRL